jgi:hypothetical protein
MRARYLSAAVFFVLALPLSSQAAVVGNNGEPDNVSGRNISPFRSTDDFVLGAAENVVSLRFWWGPGNDNPVAEFNGTNTYAFYQDNAGALGSLITSGTVADLVSIPTGSTLSICNIPPHCPGQEVNVKLVAPIPLGAGTYWLELHGRRHSNLERWHSHSVVNIISSR